MKKIVRLTESDLVRIVKRVIKESNDAKDPTTDPIQKPFWEYVSNRWGANETAIVLRPEIKYENGIYTICDGSCGSNILVDSDSVSWDYKKGIVTGTKSYGSDPKQISIKSNLATMKKWFSDTWGYPDIKTKNSRGGYTDGL